ncbi:hypothetical protein Taro_000523, partial [Colocasia esculenta]|nr:hypothetical protein [Colocasia esculenta]
MGIEKTKSRWDDELWQTIFPVLRLTLGVCPGALAGFGRSRTTTGCHLLGRWSHQTWNLDVDGEGREEGDTGRRKMQGCGDLFRCPGEGKILVKGGKGRDLGNEVWPPAVDRAPDACRQAQTENGQFAVLVGFVNWNFGAVVRVDLAFEEVVLEEGWLEDFQLEVDLVVVDLIVSHLVVYEVCKHRRNCLAKIVFL